MKLNPVSSILETISNFILGKIHFPREFNGMKVRMEDGQEFQIFRHVVIGDRGNIKNNSAAFIVKFKLGKMSIEKNKRFSRIPVPMFIGLPGFKAKFWMCDKKTGYNQGIYQWETVEDAENYSKSFAVTFMEKRSEKNTVSYKIIENCNIYNLISRLKT